MTRWWLAWQVLRGQVVETTYESGDGRETLRLTFVPTAEFKKRMYRR